MFKKLLYNEDEEVRPGVVYGLIGLAFVVGGYFVYVYWTTGGQVEAHMLCITPNCGYASERKLEKGEPFPGLCPKCGKQSVYYALTCPKCGKPHVLNESRGLRGPTKCTQCGTEIRHAG